ncbi:MAG: 30S ribosomal protein S13 [Halobacteriales archaeon]
MSTEDPADEAEEDIRYFVRIEQTDLDGTKSVERALSEMDGIGRRAARIIADDVGVSPTETLGLLDDDDIDAIVDRVTNLEEHVPPWLTNRARDYYTGETEHVVGNDLGLQRERDINRMKKINSYKGARHRRGQKVRGQRTKSTGRTEGTVAVNVERIAEERAEEEAE